MTLHFIKELEELPSFPQCVLIVDETVALLYGKPLQTALSPLIVLTVPSGEGSKTREMKEHLEDRLLELGVGRDATIIACGGGMVLDLAGFLAATYCRGVCFVSIPTTLMAMVDAAVGGKTGVNTPFGKNSIGAFYPPKAHYYYLPFLKSLPFEEWNGGMAEVLKYALIGDAALFVSLEKEWRWDEMLIRRCISQKQKIVEEDYKETGLRRTLNFGHTVGHGFEALSGYTLSHGYAVALGMLIESRLSHLVGSLPLASLRRIETLITRHYPCEIPGGDPLPFIRRDKKGGCVLIDEIGSPNPSGGTYIHPLEEESLWSALKSHAAL